MKTAENEFNHTYIRKLTNENSTDYLLSLESNNKKRLVDTE